MKIKKPIATKTSLRPYMPGVVLGLLIGVVDIMAARPVSGPSALATTNLILTWPTFILLVLGLRLWNRAKYIDWSELWRWHRTVFRYHCTITKHVILRYDANRLGTDQAKQFVSRAESYLAELEEWHSFRLRGRVRVFVLPSSKHINDIFGSGYGALAWTASRAIVVPATGPVDEILRHELSHLFTAGWNSTALPLLNEGMATWWGHNCGKSPTDALAGYFAPYARLRIRQLVDPNRFYQQASLYPAYGLAGSFTGFLIRGYGKHRYREFYRRATERNFERCFYDCFNMEFTEAETRWRMEIATTQLLRQRMEQALR